MTTSSNISPHVTTREAPAVPEQLRLHLTQTPSAGQVDGSWWPRSRDLQREAADLVDHFPASAGRINRLLFSRPDWDHATQDDRSGRGVRTIRAARGPVKVGSFPSDDTRLMILTMSSGQRMRLAVIPYDTPAGEAERRLRGTTGPAPTPQSDGDTARWDDESPGG